MKYWLIALTVMIAMSLGLLSKGSAQSLDCEENVLVMVDVPVGDVHFETTDVKGELKVVVYNHFNNASNSGPKMTGVAMTTLRLRDPYMFVRADDGVRVMIPNSNDEGILLRDLSFPADVAPIVDHTGKLGLVMNANWDIGFRFETNWTYQLVETSTLPKPETDAVSNKERDRKMVATLRRLNRDGSSKTLAYTPGFMWRSSNLLVSTIDEKATCKQVERCVGRWWTTRTPNPPVFKQ